MDMRFPLLARITLPKFILLVLVLSFFGGPDPRLSSSPGTHIQQITLTRFPRFVLRTWMDFHSSSINENGYNIPISTHSSS